jgi:hypothetical protein
MAYPGVTVPELVLAFLSDGPPLNIRVPQSRAASAPPPPISIMHSSTYNLRDGEEEVEGPEEVSHTHVPASTDQQRGSAVPVISCETRVVRALTS